MKTSANATGSRGPGKPARRVAAERLQKLLARAGWGSRRALEARIAAGEIGLNDRPAKLGDKVAPGDRIASGAERYRVVMGDAGSGRVIVLNKPLGVVCTRADPQGRPTIFDHLPLLREGRWISVGRLDISTSGLLLLTTDGELANAMMHPSSGVDREYACRVHGEVGAEQLARLKAGVELDDGPARFSDLVDSGGSGENHWYHVTLMEGRNREVRRLWEAVGVRVSRLKRVRFGALFLPSRLKVGRHEELPATDVQILREDVGLTPTPPADLVLKRLRPASARKKRGR